MTPDEDEPIQFMTCKCGEDIEGDAAHSELVVCPTCKRWGCWTQVEEEDDEQ